MLVVRLTPSFLQAARRNRLVRVEVEVDELLVDTLRGQAGLALAHDVAGEIVIGVKVRARARARGYGCWG